MAISGKVLMFAYLIIKVAQSTTENNVTRGESINGQMLITLGRKINKPMLTLLGMAIQNLHKCGEWTTWTPCEAKTLGNFGSRIRTRKCAKDGRRNETVETDWSLCEGGVESKLNSICPSDYNFTANGFCIKLYLTTKNHNDAESQCQKDGGYLINIDSEEKYTDFKAILSNGPANLWHGGRRKGTSPVWEFSYGLNNAFYNNHWYSGYPQSAPCLVFQGFLWWTTDCSGRWPFMCEIVSS